MDETKEIEKFDDSVKDEELLVQIKLWEDESESLFNSLAGIIEKNLEYYKGNQTDRDRIHGKQSNTVENRIWMAVETAVPVVTSRLPEIVCTTEADDELSQIETAQLQDVLNYKMSEKRIQEYGEKFVRDMMLKRLGVFKICWNQEKDDFEVELKDARKIRIPKFGTTVYDLKFVIEYLEMSYESAKEYFGDTFAKALLDGKDQEDIKKIRKSNFIIKEVWTNDYVVYSIPGKILKKEVNPYYDFNNPNANYFDCARKPYVIKSLFETEESIIGDTDYIQQVIPIQDNINLRKRQIENLGRKVANPILLIDSQVMSEEQAANITNEEGLILYGKDAAKGDKIRFESPGQVPNYLFEDLNESRKEFDNIFGFHSTTRGEREGRETFRGRQMLREADLGRVDLIGRQLERALGEVAEWMTQMIKMFYTEEKSYAIMGDEGVRFITGFSNEKVGKVKPSVKPGSTLPKDEVSMKENAMTLWQNKAIGLKTLYKMMKLPNIDDAVDDFVETQSGALLQQQPNMAIPPDAGLEGLRGEVQNILNGQQDTAQAA